MNDNELKVIWKQASIASSGYYPSISMEGRSKTTIAGVPAEIRTEHVSNKSTGLLLAILLRA
jgi:hypothetical protein